MNHITTYAALFLSLGLTACNETTPAPAPTEAPAATPSPAPDATQPGQTGPAGEPAK